jgi:uroporphyrinogen-III synthase
MRVIVTRPRAQAETLVARLHAAGLDAVALPLIDIVPAAQAQPVRDAWSRLAQTALVMFVSANAVQHFFALRPGGAAWPAGTLAGSTGPGTTAALRAAGVPPAAIVEPAGDEHDSESLWQRLRGRDWVGRAACVVRGEGGRDWLAERLREAGASVDFVAAYARREPPLDAGGRALLAAALARPAEHLWLFSSSEAVGHLARLAPGADWSRSRALASHPRIEAAARRLGFGRVDAAPVAPAALVAKLASIESDAS